MSVLICVPTFETITTECYKALWEMDGVGEDVMFDTVKGYDCALARIKACEMALDYGAEWLLMVDSDTSPPQDALANMLSHDVDFVMGYYQHKRGPEGVTCLFKLGNWSTKYAANELHALHENGTDLLKVQGGGMGCSLLRVSVLQRIRRPWFRWVVEADGVETGEDVYFCNQLRKAGVPVHADTRVACGHAYRSMHSI